MTKEDIKQICQIYDNLRVERNTATIAYNSDDAFYEHILATYKLSQSSLPSNIDEAAEEYAWQKEGPLAEEERLSTCFNPRIEAFKAGAEWMAGQGETIFDTIDVDGQGQRWLSDNLLLGDYDSGEEVIVQIRKK